MNNLYVNLGARGHDVSDVSSIEDLRDKLFLQNIKNVQLALGMSFKNLPSGKDNLNPGMGTLIKNTLQEKNIQIAILSCYINMIHPDEKLREEALEKFESYVKYAKYFGASMVASETGSMLDPIAYTEENFTENAYNLAVKSIKRLSLAGEKYQVMIGIEPGLNHPIYSVEVMNKLLKDINSPQIGVVLDPTNLINADTYKNQVEIVKEAFATFGEKIVAFHLKDFIVEDGKIKPVNFGEGIMNKKEILEIISENKPYLNVILEETKDNGLKKAGRMIAQF